jgi:hypothetical protein
MPSTVKRAQPDNRADKALELYFPIQNVEKIRFKMSSAVVAPVTASMGRSVA